ncbi:RBBP9/YdeN family alpha/beta hydrolase [Staphylococcus casei]|uniref:Alpha/beta hydrolase n=1 Tax=Staphylococcus casei TaxID=201828 RepID=A0ABZ2WA98_9STAP
MTDIVIVHSKYGDSTNHWYEWLANNLVLEGYNVTLFNLPVEESEHLERWVNKMREQLNIDKYETYFVTHGLGTLASLKFIEEAQIKQIEGLFSISGFMDDAQDIDENISLEGHTFDYTVVKSKVTNFYGLCAKDDQYVSYKETKRLMDTLGGKCKITDNGGHFMEEDGFRTFTILQGKMQKLMSS